MEFPGIKPTLTWLFQIELLTQVVKKLRYNRVNCILLCQTSTVNYSICLWLVFIFDGCYIFNHNILINLKRNNGLWKTWTVQVQLYSSESRPWSTIIQCRNTVLTVRLWNDFSVPVLTWNYLLSELFFLRKFWKMGKTTKNDRNKNGLDQRTGLIFVRVGPNLRKIGPKSSEVSLNMTILNRHLKKTIQTVPDWNFLYQKSSGTLNYSKYRITLVLELKKETLPPEILQ